MTTATGGDSAPSQRAHPRQIDIPQQAQPSAPSARDNASTTPTSATSIPESATPKHPIPSRGKTPDHAPLPHLPVLLVHGLNARDWTLYTSPNWGRIPGRLRDEGYKVYFANQDSWYGIDHNARQIAEAIVDVIAETGAPKLHLIAHSKGGLDARRAVHLPDIAQFVASVTTLATPHKGLNYANLLSYVPFIPRYIVSPFVRAWAHAQGDPHPETMQLLADMTTRHLEDFDARYPDLPGIEYRSYAFVAKRPRVHVSNPGTMLLRLFDGRNDGVVPYWSTDQPHRQLIYVIGRQKVTHDEPVDMHRRDITLMTEDGTVYDSMPDFMVDLVKELDADAGRALERETGDAAATGDAATGVGLADTDAAGATGAGQADADGTSGASAAETDGTTGAGPADAYGTTDANPSQNASSGATS